MSTELDQIYDKAMMEVNHYLDMGRAEQALEKGMKLLSHYPENGFLLYKIARCHYLLDQYEQAIHFTREALRVGFAEEYCYFLLGVTYLESGKYVESEEAFLHALRHNPGDADSLAAYGYLMLLTGHEDKADRLLEEALRIDPENSNVLHYQLMFSVAKEKFDEQDQFLEQYVQVADSEKNKLIHMGMTELSRKNFKQAREYYRQAFLMDPTDARILEILKDLDEATHFLFFPQRLIMKLGGPIPVWLGFIVLMFVLNWLDWGVAASIIAPVYLVLVILSWTTPLIYKIWMKWSKA